MTPSIVTFTANPSVDRTAEVAELRRGGVSRAVGSRVDGGGKGVNVTRALALNGHASTAVLPIGGAEGHQLASLLARERLDVRTVPIRGAIRVNVTIVEPDGTTTKINEPGPDLSPDEVAALTGTLREAAAGADWAVLSGSLPAGAPRDLYGRLTESLHRLGVRVALDADGEPLTAALSAGPDVVKPNRRELADASGLPVGSVAEALVAIDVLRRAGARAVLASLGPDGAVLVENGGAFHAEAEPVALRSTVGAGDAMLAGFLAAGGSGPAALAAAVAWGTAAVALPGSAMPDPAHIDRSSVHVNPLTTLEVA
jgi:1-phosphofructokinase